jgi:hypothetical protein
MDKVDRDILLKKLRSNIKDKSDTRNKKIRRRENYNILDTVKEMMEDKHVLSRPQLSRKYLQLKQEHEPLYNMVLNQDLTDKHLALLESMINEREKVRNGQISYEEAQDIIATQNAEIHCPEILRPAPNTDEPQIEEL